MHRPTPPPTPQPSPRPTPPPHPLAVLPTPTPHAQVHTTTAPPRIITDTAAPATNGSPEAAFILVAVTLPALIAAGASFINHAVGRHR
ncbi:hypothetical protein [Streptacidiphilus carbonis]|uniref:hypothetical protein n=1 Tax=Streptacidiphilus carbonis TaxID=105422 RepID=UPI00137874EF|nr:hypothetical protein [Streptacidiphilus carbonis]